MVDISEVRKLSMLDNAVLERLQALARYGNGGILEIGAYIGGSTIALASGHEGRRPHAVIECGGSYLEHPQLPSGDIIYDWTVNMSRFRQAGNVRLYPGLSMGPVRFPAIRYLNEDIGLFFFDGDGRCDQQFAVFTQYMRPGAAIVLDDYMAHGDQAKATLVKAWVDRAVEAGGLIPEDIIDCTWFGWLGKSCPELTSYFEKSEGHAYLAHSWWPDPTVPMRVLEDGKPLGPANSNHDLIVREGGGRFSHWVSKNPYVLFSTSDNSDPNTNGRKYEFG